MIERSIAQSVLRSKPLRSDWIEESAQEVIILHFSAFPVRKSAQVWSFQRVRMSYFLSLGQEAPFYNAKNPGSIKINTKRTCNALDREGALINDFSLFETFRKIAEDRGGG